MANYFGITRTNYFHVTDPERLEKIIDATITDEDGLEVWACEGENGTLYAFGCYGSIVGLRPSFENEGNNEFDDDDDEPEYDIFQLELQKIVDPDDAIIITEIGYEKLRYLTAYNIIITAKECECVELRESSIDIARRMLGDMNWNTRMGY